MTMNNYLGQAPVFGDFPFQILTGDGTASYNLNYQVSNENGMLVFLNGAIQRPGVDFTAGGTSLVFSEAVAIGVQIFTYGMGLPKSTLAPSAGSVGTAELAAGVKASGANAQDWTNTSQILTPDGLDDALKGVNQSLAVSGFQKFPGGLIVQWGRIENPSTAAVLGFVFPVEFPNAVTSVILTPLSTNPAAAYTANGPATTGVNIYKNASATNYSLSYLVFGY